MELKGPSDVLRIRHPMGPEKVRPKRSTPQMHLYDGLVRVSSQCHRPRHGQAISFFELNLRGWTERLDQAPPVGVKGRGDARIVKQSLARLEENATRSSSNKRAKFH